MNLAAKFCAGLQPDQLPSHLMALVAKAPDEQVFFAPGPEPLQHTLAAINAAKKIIRFQAYNFSSPEITAALIAAKRRGVDVKGIIDHKALCERSCTATECVRSRIPVYDDAKHPIAHAKVIVVDDELVLCGSYNWSKQAARNSEDLVILRGAEPAEEFEKNWHDHLSHSTHWEP